MAGEIFVGSVAVGVVPDARGWEQKLRDQIVEPSKKVGDEAGKELGKHIADEMPKEGDDAAANFGKSYKAKLKEVLDSIPKVELNADSTEADRKVAELRAKIEELHRQDVIDPRKAVESITLLETDVKALARMSKDIKVDFNIKSALTKLQIMRDATKLELGALGGGVSGRKGPTLSGAETLIGTGAGAAGAGGTILGNIMSFFGGIKGFFGGGAGGGGGGASAAAAAASSGGGGGGLSSLMAGGFMQPAVLIPLITAAAPFIGQIVGGAIVGVLGAGLAGMGIAGAVMSGKLTGWLKDLGKQIKTFMTIIGTPFIGSLGKIFATIGKLLSPGSPFMIAMTQAGIIIAKAFTPFVTAIVKSFGQPAVAKSILAVAGAFAAILTAVTPQIAPDMNLIANSITDLATAIGKNPQAMANVFQYIVNIVNFLISAATKLANVATNIEQWDNGAAGKALGAIARHIGDIVQAILPLAALVSGAGGTPQEPGPKLPGGGVTLPKLPGGNPLLPAVPGTPQGGWQAQIGNLIKGAFSIANPPSWMKAISDQSIGNFLGGLRHGIAAHANELASLGIDMSRNIAHGVVSFWQANVTLFNDLVSIGQNIVLGIYHGILMVLDTIGTWINDHILKPFISALTNSFGIASPAKKTQPIGQSIIDGIFSGIVNALLAVGTWVDNHIFKPIINAILGAFGLGSIGTGGGGKNENTNNTSMFSIGQSIIQGLLNGMLDIFNSIHDWIGTHIYHPLVNAVIAWFGATSPAKKMIPIGRSIITGVITGMIKEGKHIGRFVADVFGGWPEAILKFVSKGLVSISSLPKKALQALGGALGVTGGAPGIAQLIGLWNKVSSSGSGVTRWSGLVSKALTMLGLPQQLVAPVLYQMETESGGDPNAINNWDINAKRGDPSRGLMQTTGSTFARYHVPGTAFNIYDPLANIAAAINYAMHVYGRNLRNNRGGIGSGKGYDTGGFLPTGVTLAYNMTGKPERVLSPAEYEAYGKGNVHNGNVYEAHFDGLTGAAIESHVRTAFHLMTLQQGNMYRQGRRS
jgi:hypothetical protein